jgi:sugar phosphate isomerase/epimerase
MNSIIQIMEAYVEIAICSFSFFRTFLAGKQDIFQYIRDCKALGATQLDPWDAHFAPLKAWEMGWKIWADPDQVQLMPEEQAYLNGIKRAAEEAGLPFGCICVDGAHVYEAAPRVVRANRAAAYKWLQIANLLGARQVRFDAGGPAEMPEGVFEAIVEGYSDLVARAGKLGIEVLVENHWGPSQVPENLMRILDAVDGLGLLLDTHNWAPDRKEDGWRMCAPYAKASHIKTFSFDEEGNEPSVDVPKAMRILLGAGYQGAWGIECMPMDGDEYAGVRKTIQLIERVLAG